MDSKANRKVLKMDQKFKVTANHIKWALENGKPFEQIFIPEFTFGCMRIDAVIIDVKKRIIKGYEIKTSKSDFKRDKKWRDYAQFCSTLSVVCPNGLIKYKDVEKPYGLINYDFTSEHSFKVQHPRRPEILSDPESPEWKEIYMRVLETEFPRMYGEFRSAKIELMATRHGNRFHDVLMANGSRIDEN